MNEHELSEFARGEGMWPFDAKVFARWATKTELSMDKAYMKDWIERFRTMSGLSNMDLKRVRDYAKAIIEIEAEWS